MRFRPLQFYDNRATFLNVDAGMKEIHDAPFTGAEPETNSYQAGQFETTVPADGFSTLVQAVSKYTS
jgi:hypothetical protein